MTGKIYEVVGRNKSYCLIRGDDGRHYMARKVCFPDPSYMLEGVAVKFDVTPFHPVKNVIPCTSSTALEKVS